MEPWTLPQRHALLLARGSDGMRRVVVPPSTAGIVELFLLFALWLLNLADLVVTVHWVGDVGWAAEGNAFLRAVAATAGPVGFVLYKVLLMTLVVLVLWWLYRRFEAEAAAARGLGASRLRQAMCAAALVFTFIVVGFYGWVVWNNLHVVGLL